MVIADEKGTVAVIVENTPERAERKRLKYITKDLWKMTARHLDTCETCHLAGGDGARPSDLCSKGAGLRRAYVALDSIGR